MSDLVPTASPFDAIRREDERGEYWRGRDLQPLMGYTNWRQFTVAVERAKLACSNSGEDQDHHVEAGLNINDLGYEAQDVRLTRFGAYLVALNGDPRKSEVAAAQTYFAVKAREAEVQQAEAIPAVIEVPLDDYERLCAGGQQLIARLRAVEATATEQAKELETARPKAEYVDAFVEDEGDLTPLRVLANQLGVQESALRQHLVDFGLIYRKFMGLRWSGKLQRHIEEHQYYAYAKKRPAWFKVVDLPKTPRLPDGQMRTALHVTPVGKVGIRNLLKRRPIGALNDRSNVTELPVRRDKSGGAA